MKCYLNPEGAAAVQAAIAQHRRRLAALRKTRAIRHMLIQVTDSTEAAAGAFRKAGESITIAGQRFRTMADRLTHQALRAADSRFDGEPVLLSGFGDFE